MSQAPNPFTQAASQGYGDFAPTLDEDEHEETHEGGEDELEGPQSPEPEEPETDEHGFTQTQERSYPTGIESPDEDENADQAEASDRDEQPINNNDDDDDDDEAGPSSPAVAASDDEDEAETTKNQSHSRRRVQIADDSDNEDEPQAESTSVVSKEKNRHFLKQFVAQSEPSPKKQQKRRSDEGRHHHDKKAKRFRQTSDDGDEAEHEEKDADNVEATSDVDDVVDDIFGKNDNDNEEAIDDREETAAELRDLQDDEAVQQDDEEEDVDQQQTFNADEDDEAPTASASRPNAKSTNITYDIDLYLEKKAERRRGNRRRGAKNGDVDLAGPDGDELVAKLIDQMKIATEEDRIFNKSRQPATAKLLLLPLIEQHLRRADLTESFLDHGILTVCKDWLSPLPDKSLPNIKIRESLIVILQQFGVINAESLRDSGIGRALMYLYKHPRETKENKIKLIRIIQDWARPIFNLDTDYKLLTREERQQRDADQASLKRQTSLTNKPKNRSADVDLPFARNKRQDDDDANNDEDCPRARVPRPSNKDYVVRPVSTVDYSDKKGDEKKKTVSRLDELKRRQQDRKRLSKPMSIVKLSIEGNKMHL